MQSGQSVAILGNIEVLLVGPLRLAERRCQPPEGFTMESDGRTVVVNLIDDATGAAFAQTQMPAADLPETFAIETTMRWGDVDWSILHAEPQTRLEFSEAGSLTLRLRRVEKIDPTNLRFSLPSICDKLAAIGDRALAGDECVLHEDDWRQFELVSRQFAVEADAEIEAIRHIREQKGSGGLGFLEVRVRVRPDPPIAAPLTLDDVNRAFGDGLAFRGVTYRGAGSLIAAGFSFTAPDGLQCYGLAESGRVTVLGIVLDAPESPPIQSTDALIELARDFNLDLVQWCRCARASWDNPMFRQLLGGRAG
jgi:hypothetical protein